MKRLNVINALLALAMVLSLSPSSWAFPDLVGETVKVSNGTYGTTNGGEFNLDIGNDGSVDYISFCLERDEYINYTDLFTIQSVQDAATNGGVNVWGPGSDEVSYITEWVFYTYVYGTFTDANKQATTLSGDRLANYVQYLIWVLEGETTYDRIFSLSQYTITGNDISNFYDTYVKNFASDIYDDYVTVLNLMDS